MNEQNRKKLDAAVASSIEAQREVVENLKAIYVQEYGEAVANDYVNYVTEAASSMLLVMGAEMYLPDFKEEVDHACVAIMLFGVIQVAVMIKFDLNTLIAAVDRMPHPLLENFDKDVAALVRHMKKHVTFSNDEEEY